MDPGNVSWTNGVVLLMYISFIFVHSEIIRGTDQITSPESKFQDDFERKILTRSIGGTFRCDNPTLYQFGQQELSLLVMKSELIRDLRGNTRRGNQNQIHLDVNDMRKLPQKRKRYLFIY